MKKSLLKLSLSIALLLPQNLSAGGLPVTDFGVLSAIGKEILQMIEMVNRLETQIAQMHEMLQFDCLYPVNPPRDEV
jgi:uncharacterized membrane protein